jgi:hypothetical protein
MKTSEPKPTKEEILENCLNEIGFSFAEQLKPDNITLAQVRKTKKAILKAMQEFAEAFHKEKLRDEFDKINCLTGYLERWSDNPLSVPPFELKDVIMESNEWINKYLKTIE